MKISKLFHWLYAILMFLPFIVLAFNFVRLSFSGDLTLITSEDILNMFAFPTSYATGVYSSILNVYLYLVQNIFGITVTGSSIPAIIVRSLAYWTFISIVYLIFDVLMYVPLLVHRWIDKARLE